MSVSYNKFFYLRGNKNKYKCNLLQFDGNSKPNPGALSCGIIIMSPKVIEDILTTYRTPLFEYGYYKKDKKYDNNESEFYALFKGLEHALENDIYDLVIEGDSLLVIDSIINKKVLRKPYSDYLEKIQLYIPIFNTLAVRHIKRDKNDEADYLARIAYIYNKNFETRYFD